MNTNFCVAFYKDGNFQGRVAHRAEIQSREDAKVIAARWREAHANKHDYRACEFDKAGRLIWSDK
jgi:hypothetical protein